MARPNGQESGHQFILQRSENTWQWSTRKGDEQRWQFHDLIRKLTNVIAGWCGRGEVLAQNRRGHAPKWPQSAWWMQGEHCGRGRDLVWKLHLSHFLLHGIQGNFIDLGQNPRNATWHTGGFLIWRFWSAFNNSATWLKYQRRQFGWYFKPMRDTVFCKVNCFCGTQMKQFVILALLRISKISD